MKNVQTKIQNQKGFTLVEIAIVLVIIGLLLGGVLKGQELIENSKVKSVVSDIENVTAAYYGYRDRKGFYPNDTSSSANTTAGTAQFWGDLRGEGFIIGSGNTNPSHALDGAIAYDTDNTDTGFDKAICVTNIEDTTATNIDTKYDDGVGSTGDIQSIGGVVYTATGAPMIVCKKL